MDFQELVLARLFYNKNRAEIDAQILRGIQELKDEEEHRAEQARIEEEAMQAQEEAKQAQEEAAAQKKKAALKTVSKEELSDGDETETDDEEIVKSEAKKTRSSSRRLSLPFASNTKKSSAIKKEKGVNAKENEVNYAEQARAAEEKNLELQRQLEEVRNFIASTQATNSTHPLTETTAAGASTPNAKRNVKFEESPLNSVGDSSGDSSPITFPCKRARHDCWDICELIPPKKSLPEGQTEWTNKDAIGAWCTICKKKIEYSSREPRKVIDHYIKKHKNKSPQAQSLAPNLMAGFSQQMPQYGMMQQPFGAPPQQFAFPQYAQQPFAAPQQPFAAPQQPFAALQQPFAAPQQPFAAPQQQFPQVPYNFNPYMQPQFGMMQYHPQQQQQQSIAAPQKKKSKKNNKKK
jgi:hypothetical protein